MPKCISVKVPKISAEPVRQVLLRQKLMRFGLSPAHDAQYVYFPLAAKPEKEELRALKKVSSKIALTQKQFKESGTVPAGNLKQALQGKLTATELEYLISAYDVVGTIAVIQVPKELMKWKKLIAKTVLELNKGIETVCMIAGPHQGKYRTQAVTILAGKRTKETLYKEHGCQFKLDIEKVFFSPRLSFERGRIAKLIQPGETVGAFFSGVGPFSIVFAKNSPAQKIYSLELNPSAVKYHKLNNELNKVAEKIELLKGDVRKLVPLYVKGKCDRVVMPLPETGEFFLEEAFAALKPSGGIIHFYTFAPRDDLYTHALGEFEKVAQKFNRKLKVLRKEICRTFSAKTVQIVLDIQVR